MKSIINFITGSLLTTVVYFLGGWDIALQTLVVMVTLDYFTGILKAIVAKKLSSEIGVKGIVRKVGYFILVGVSELIDRNTGDTGAIRTLVIYFFICNEGISILENWTGMGLKTPKALKDMLKQLNKDKGCE
jgi:toxin secretion/phage lysis holin